MSVWRSPVLYIGILLIAVVAGLLGAPFLVDWNHYRETVEEYGRQLTGRDVAVTGDISVRLFPWPHIRLKGVRVANVPGTLIADVVRAETVEARMLLGSLLGGRVEVSNIRIVKPVFSFERLDTSEVNWWFTPQFAMHAPVEAERISIEDLEIVDGTVFISDTRRGGTAQFEGVDMSLSAQSLLGPWKAKGELVQSGRPFSIGISTSTYKAGEPFGFTFRFSPVEGPGLVYTFDGAYSAASDEPLTGTITAEPYVAASGKSNSQSKVRALVFKAEIGFREDHALLRNIEIAPADREHAGNLLTGSAAIELQERISVMADLRSPNYDLDAMLGSTGREVLKSGAFLGGLSRFLEVLPGTLDGRVRLDIANLVVGGAKLEGTRLEAELSENGLTIHELAVTMPGQTRSRLIGKFVAGGEQPLLTGEVTVESANTREFVSWLMPEWKETIASAWSGARGKLDLAAQLDHQPQSLKLTDGRLKLDEAEATGSLSVVGGSESQMSLRVAVDRLDADRYLGQDAAVGHLKDYAAAAVKELFRPDAPRNNVQLTVFADELKLHGAEARDVEVDLAAGNDAINVHALNIGNVGDARLAVTGSLKPGPASRRGMATIEVDAANPEPLLRLLGMLGAPNGGAAKPPWVQALGPLHARFTGDADISDDTVAARMGATGTAGGSSFAANGAVDGDPSDFQAARVKLSADILSPDTTTLARLFGIEGQREGEDQARLTLSLAGTSRDGLESVARLTALGAEASFDGTLTRLAPALAAAGNVKVDAGSGDRVLAAVGIPNPQPGAPLSVESKFEVGGGRVSLEGFSALIAGKRFEGRLAAGRGKIDVQAKAADVALPWMLAAALLPNDGRSVDGVTLFAPRPMGGATGMVSVEADVLTLAPHLAIRDARVVFDASADKFRVSLSGMGSADGLVTADAEIVRRIADYEVSGTFSAGLDLGEQLRNAAGQPVITAPARLNGTFSGAGRSPAGLASVLRGSGKMTFSGGSLPGVDRGRLVLGLAGATGEQDVDAALGQAFSGGDLAFSAGTAALAIADGVASLGPVGIRAGELSGDMKALVDLMNGRAELQVELAMPGLNEAPAVSLAYSGARDALERRLDASAFKTRLKARALREEMAKLEELQRQEEKIIQQEMLREAEERRRVEKDRRAREREDDLNGLLGVVMTDVNRWELARRKRELAAWRAPLRRRRNHRDRSFRNRRH